MNDLYEKVKNEYAAVQHLLTVEQRQEFRRRIAKLATSDVHATAQFVMAKASVAAPQIARSVIRSIFDSLKLK